MPAICRKHVLFLAAALWGCGLLHAQMDKDELALNSRPASREEIAGIWEMTFQRFSKPVENDPEATARYQIFAFLEDGVFKNITATRRVSDEDRALFLDIMPANTRWEVPEAGLLVIRRSELDADGVEARRVTQDFQDELLSGSPPLKRGDLVLIYKDKQGIPYLRRYLQPIHPEQ